jgi:carboxylesterase type B
MCYEFNFPVRPLIKRTIQYSNAIPAQPKSIEESQAAFDGLLQAFQIPVNIPSAEKMKRLRAVPAEQLMDTIMSL